MGVRATPPLVLKPVPQRLGLEYATEEGGGESIRPVAEVCVGDVRVINERPSPARWGVLVACRHEVEEAVPVGVGGRERKEESGAALGGKIRLELLLLGVLVRPKPCDVGAVPTHALDELLRLRRTRPEQMPHVLYRHGGVPWVLV